jgi:LAS superfamily LD-carboxypeptidase LdcB
MNFNILTGRDNTLLTPLDDKRLIHPDTLSALKKLKELALLEIGAQIEVISSFRSFEDQQRIWNLKASGKRDLFDINEKKLDFNSLTKKELLNAILQWSAIPGGSRHHWGTDIDIFDASKVKEEDVKLLNSECTPDGVCGDLHSWLDEKIKDNNSFGFFRPYDTDRNNTGVGKEKWHISYSPISNDYLKSFTYELFLKNIQESTINLKELVLSDLELIYENYVLNIDTPPF